VQNPIEHAPPAVVRALYLAAAYLVVAPFLFELQRILPPHPGDLDWRFGAAGFVLTAVTTPVLGLTAMMVVAILRGRAGPMRAVAVLSGIVALGILLTAVSFGRDLGTMLPETPGVAARLLRATAARTLVGSGTAFLVLLALAWAGLVAAHRSAALRRG
jgi:hypothetical protein